MKGFERSTVALKNIGTLLPSLGTIYNGGYWTVPAIGSLANAFEAIQGSKQVVEGEYPRWRTLLK